MYGLNKYVLWIGACTSVGMPGFRVFVFVFVCQSLEEGRLGRYYTVQKKKSDLEVERITKWCQILAAEVVQG